MFPVKVIYNEFKKYLYRDFTQENIRKLCKQYCEEIDVKITFLMFNPIPYEVFW